MTKVWLELAVCVLQFDLVLETFNWEEDDGYAIQGRRVQINCWHQWAHGSLLNDEIRIPHILLVHPFSWNHKHKFLIWDSAAIQPLSKIDQSFWPVHCPNCIKAAWASSHTTWVQMMQPTQLYTWYYQMVCMLIFLSCTTTCMYTYVSGIFGMDEDTKFLLLVTQAHHSALLLCRKQQGLSIA